MAILPRDALVESRGEGARVAGARGAGTRGVGARGAGVDRALQGGSSAFARTEGSLGSSIRWSALGDEELGDLYRSTRGALSDARHLTRERDLMYNQARNAEIQLEKELARSAVAEQHSFLISQSRAEMSELHARYTAMRAGHEQQVVALQHTLAPVRLALKERVQTAVASTLEARLAPIPQFRSKLEAQQQFAAHQKAAQQSYNSAQAAAHREANSSATAYAGAALAAAKALAAEQRRAERAHAEALLHTRTVDGVSQHKIAISTRAVGWQAASTEALERARAAAEGRIASAADLRAASVEAEAFVAAKREYISTALAERAAHTRLERSATLPAVRAATAALRAEGADELRGRASAAGTDGAAARAAAVVAKAERVAARRERSGEALRETAARTRDAKREALLGAWLADADAARRKVAQAAEMMALAAEARDLIRARLQEARAGSVQAR
ncbi:hypothetical protein T492DRAFT_839498 [Pavlovales sp. CCMP2436]|nr:hypothetical protein T492DRAFT_839498 [Pavlovales sp. CCMP2436]